MFGHWLFSIFSHVILWCIIDYRRGDGAFRPSALRMRIRRRHSFHSPLVSSRLFLRPITPRNAWKIETWWRFTRTKTDRLLRKFNRLMTGCRCWHLVIGGCALLVRVSSLSPSLPLSSFSLFLCSEQKLHVCNCPMLSCLFAKKLKKKWGSLTPHNRVQVIVKCFNWNITKDFRLFYYHW